MSLLWLIIYLFLTIYCICLNSLSHKNHLWSNNNLYYSLNSYSGYNSNFATQQYRGFKDNSISQSSKRVKNKDYRFEILANVLNNINDQNQNLDSSSLSKRKRNKPKIKNKRRQLKTKSNQPKLVKKPETIQYIIDPQKTAKDLVQIKELIQGIKLNDTSSKNEVIEKISTNNSEGEVSLLFGILPATLATLAIRGNPLIQILMIAAYIMSYYFLNFNQLTSTIETNEKSQNFLDLIPYENKTFFNEIQPFYSV